MSTDERPPETVGNFRVIRRLASGGTSDVLLARPIKPAGDHRPVVLKMLLPAYRDDPTFERMLAREAEAYGRLHHPFIVQLFEVFAVRDKLVIVLEYVDGLALNRLRAQLQGGGSWLDDRASAYLAWCLFSALSAAHNARDPETGALAPVIHRDINPSNVLIPWDGRVKLADFSIAKVTGMTGGDTRAGITKGTFGYMAPEQVRGEKVTEKTDIYTATLLLWEQLARRKAIQYSALPEIEVMRAMAYPHLVSLDVLRPDLPDALRRAVAIGLETDPASRELSADDMVGILREFVAPDEGRRLLQDTLYRLREGEDEQPVDDRSWSKMTPISVPEASYNGGALAREDSSLPVFPLESETSDARTFAKPVVAEGAELPVEARKSEVPDIEVETMARPTPSMPTTVSFSDLLLPRAADPMGSRPDVAELPEGAELSNPPSSIPPPDHQATLLGGLEVPPPPDFITRLDTQVDEHEAATAPPPSVSEPMPIEETLVSQSPAAIPTPRPVSVSISESPSGIPLSDLSQTQPSDPLGSPASGRAASPMAATVPAIPSAIMGPSSERPGGGPAVANAVAASLGGKPASTQRTSRLPLVVGGVVLFVVSLGIATLYFSQAEQSASQVNPPEPAVTAPPAPAVPPSAQAAAETPPASASASAIAETKEPKAEAKVEPKAEAKVEPKAEAKVEPKAEPKAEAKEPKAEAKVEPKEPAAVPAAGGNTGTLVVEKGGGHRVFVDGKVVGNGAGNHTVPCGKRTVKIGSNGTPQELTIPCGGTVTAP